MKFGPPEKVYVELDWYDGPRSGISNINGTPHRFISNFDETMDEYSETFTVFPITNEILALEQEQWSIFVQWNIRFEKGIETTDSHPGHGGINARWDEIEALLKESRINIPSTAKRASAKFERIEQDRRYAESGPDYALRWSLE